jgi:hypothetical protein
MHNVQRRYSSSSCDVQAQSLIREPGGGIPAAKTVWKAAVCPDAIVGYQLTRNFTLSLISASAQTALMDFPEGHRDSIGSMWGLSSDDLQGIF